MGKKTMTEFNDLSFIDNPAISTRADHYATLMVDTGKVLKSWKSSLFSYEWLLPDGRLKNTEELPAGEQEKRRAVEERLKKHDTLEKPVLGIGILENVEIGIGKAIFLTLAAHGVAEIPVHVPRSHEKEFKSFVAR